MTDPFTLTAIMALITASASSWLDVLKSTVLDKGKELVINKGTEYVRDILHLDEREQQRHLQVALKNAIERGLAKFHTLHERDQYRDILRILFESNTNSDFLRNEAMRLFTLSDTPNLSELNEVYNRSIRIRALSQPTPPLEVDATPYLRGFFDALLAELYADPYFKYQMSDVMRVRAAMCIQQSLIEVVTMLHHIGETLMDSYTVEQFAREITVYVTHIERTFHYLKLVGVVPKDQIKDPELDGIFVPLRISLQDPVIPIKKEPSSITALLEQHPYIVLLGGPGSGKSTTIRHLAWSHAITNQSSINNSSLYLLWEHPFPIRIELRRLSEERRLHNYSFLSYATEVLLKREGIEINLQMFEELLERRAMLLLFDGLDEVATLDERSRLVEEIEHFALRYPGNRMIVTSRPVGYELATLSNQIFVHAKVQEFADEQIHQFLERWYRYVLQLSPIPHQDRQELETLFHTLTGNTRLRSLGKNPLLLTVITALYRSERLPDRRAQVYDRCAKLLLETWAKLKGTNARWQNMRMIEEDQYACVAHLGFVLHTRSQEMESPNAKQVANLSALSVANDVSARFMLREIERFLRNQNSIVEVSEQRAEAKRFLELIQVEAGLIVEQGKDDNGESLYGFVHRTFQEYFAAAHVYEQFLETDPTIIRTFLDEHLHDPHWREVILLLLGKLVRKQATNQLRQVLDGKISSHHERDGDSTQELFFVCDCLAEEIAVENDLIELVISRLISAVKNSPSIGGQEVLSYFHKLIRTRQCAELARKELRSIVTKNIIENLQMRAFAAIILFQNSPIASEDRQQAFEVISQIVQTPTHSAYSKIKIFDYYVDALLETWAKLKFTDARWQNMRMVKEDQYACVAHLGFVLHTRSQEIENEGADTSERCPNTLPTSLVLREIEHFINTRQLITNAEEQYDEAKRVFEFMQAEANLIIERETDDDSERCWGFVHRSFQEYFAAINVYECYQQEEDPRIVTEFLKERRHDPHWHNVLLLLLSKLKRKPATTQLRRILNYNGEHSEVVPQDLLFVSTCLQEEIPVEIDFAELVVSLLYQLVKMSSDMSNQSESLDALTKLMHMAQYTSIVQRQLMPLGNLPGPSSLDSSLRESRSNGPKNNDKRLQ